MPPEGENQEVARPDWLPETHWNADAKAPNLEALQKDYAELPALRTFKTEQETKLAALPKTAAEYKLDLPSDVKLPDGYAYNQTPEAKAVYAPFLEIFRKYDLPQDGVTEVLREWAKLNITGMTAEQAADAAAEAEAKAAEEKFHKGLGDKGKDRIAAGETYLKANFKDDELEAVSGLLRSVGGVKIVERMIAGKDVKFSGLPGGAGEKPDLSGMTARQKLDYANAEAARAANH